MYNKCLITGTGRSGTCLTSAAVESLQFFNFKFNGSASEDRALFTYSLLPNKYATKLTTDHKSFTLDNFCKLIDKNNDLIVIFSIRHPYDCCLSQMFRGLPKKYGGDCYEKAPNCNVDIAIKRVLYSIELYNAAKSLFGERIFLSKMEDLLLGKSYLLNNVCRLCGIKSDFDLHTIYKFNHNPHHKNRYKSLDRSQIDIWRQWAHIYDGFFSNKQNDVKKIFHQLRWLAINLGYEVL